MSQRTLTTLLNRLGKGEEDLKCHSLANEMDTALNIDTPYGPLLSSVSLPKKEPKDASDMLTWTHTNPFALMFELCRRFAPFARFMYNCYQQAETKLRKVAMFTDETVPGNAFHPDLTRQVQCHYFTLTIFPHWWRRRKHGWWPLGYMRMATEGEIDGELSCVLKHMLHKFFNPDGFNLSVGMRLPGPFGDYYITLQCGAMIQDMKAHQHANAIKGSAGTKCCAKCKNVLNIAPERIEKHPYFHHYSVVEPYQWDLHTADSYWEMADTLSQSFGKVSKAKFKSLEQELGLNFAPNGILYDKHCRQHYSPPSNLYEDWMHTLYASGGAGQYEINAFVLAVKGIPQFKGIDVLKMLDAFAGKVYWPSDRKKLPKQFFETRVRPNFDDHIKAFAVEAMAATGVLDCFCEMVLREERHLPDHCLCMGMLAKITRLLGHGDGVLRQINLLRRLVHEHRILFVRIYGTELAKPKIHHLEHIPDSMERHGVNLDCRPMETKHATTKRMSEHMLVPASAEATVLKRTLFAMLHDMTFNECEPICLVDPCIGSEDLRTHLQLLMPSIGQSIKIARSMHTHVGLLSLDSLVQLSHGSDTKVLGKTRLFACGCDKASQKKQCFVVYESYQQVTPTEWVAGGILSIAAAEDIIDSLPFAADGKLIRPMFYDV